ncbi:MAG: phospholipid carrier-dependent glycosyltransferase [Deltaproteobacteria bacterium]|nr:phospholipid carrier-dependent glycosyltransferase [Deltaproteobacteria bacterium]
MRIFLTEEKEHSDHPTKAHLLLRWGVLAFLVTVAVSEIIMNFTPPVSRDALIHHLAIPKLYVKKGLFHNLPFSIPSYYPMNLDLLYWAVLRMGAETPAKFIHMSFGLGTAILIFLHLRRESSETAAWLGSMFFFTTPIIVKLSTAVYVDLGFIFFSTLAVLSLLRWHSEGFRRRWLLLAIAGSGLAMGTKYSGILLLPLLTAVVVRLRVSGGGGSASALRDALVFTAGSLMLFLPWCIKNVLQTGNPLYPLFLSVLGGPEYVSYGPVPGALLYRKWMYGEQWWQTLLAPLRMFFQGQDDVPRYFDGILSPALVVFLPIVLWRGGPRYRWLLFGFCVLYGTFVFFRGGDIRVRYILPLVPFLAILAAQGVVRFWRLLQGHPVARAALGFLVVALMVQNSAYCLDFFRKVDPMPLVRGKETREEYIRRRVPDYSIMSYANAHLPEDTRILFLFMGNRGYYCERDYVYDTYFSGESFRRVIASSCSADDILKYLESQRITHILLNKRLTLDFFHNNLQPEKERNLHYFLKKYVEPVRVEGTYYLLQVKR